VTTRGRLARIGAVAALAGAPILFVATLLHPMSAAPNDAPAAFAEYAASRIWVATHLGQFVGFALLCAALVGVAAAMEAGAPAAWARLGVVGAAASLAGAATLQAVDGVALKLAVDRWAGSTGAARERAFEAAFAVRQVEIGAASLLSIVSGVTVGTFALAMLASRRFPAWVGAIGLLGGLATVAAGVVQAYTGFSALAMLLSMPAGCVMMAWAMVVGALLWPLAPALADS